ncbi:hypothetical protein [Bacillus fonticola]|uniref:hypothetical protein n=1 Tax=Bacillus fonticola TaxID=2728853 RepID=UPI0014728E15|nr:hypothetical protein [Bacillus fonticola]
METFGRGCLYNIVFVAVMMVVAFIFQANINIPFFIAIPVVLGLFYLAHVRTRDKNR